MNHITVAGRLGRDMELRYTAGGDAVGTFTVADDQGRDKPAIWWRCQLWGTRAESLQPYLTKGASVTVVGRVQEQEWTDQNGQQRKTLEVRVADIALQGGRQQGQGQQQSQHQGEARAPRQRQPQQQQQQAFNDFQDDDIPF